MKHRCRTHGPQPVAHFKRWPRRDGSIAAVCYAKWLAAGARYNRSEKGRSRYRKYDRTPKRAASFAIYAASDGGRARALRYNRTEKGLAREFVSNLKRGRI